MFPFKQIGLLYFLSSTSFAGERLVFMQEVDGKKKIILSENNGKKITTLSKEGEWGLYPDLSADGQVVSYSEGSNEKSLGIVLKNLRTNTVEHWTPHDGRYLHADLSGDGKYLAFSGPVEKSSDGKSTSQRIAWINLEKERGRGYKSKQGNDLFYEPNLNVVPSPNAAYFPCLSSNGDFLIYQVSTAKGKFLIQRNLTDHKETHLTPEDGIAMSPALSFDDRYVVYTAKVKGVWDLHRLDLWSGKTIQLTNTPFEDFAPTFKADGSIIYAANPSSSGFQLYQISIENLQNGSFKSEQIIALPGDLYAPSFSGETRYDLSLNRKLLEPGRSSFGAVSHGGKIYVAGGHKGHEHTYPPESFSNLLDIYDMRTQTWSRGATLSLPRHGFNLAAYGNYIYAFGGFAYSAEHSPQWKSVDLIERYNIKENIWEVVGKLPAPRSSNVVAQVGQKVYLIGGWDSTPKKPKDFEGKFHESIDVFDLEKEAITTSDLKIPAPLRRAFSSVVIGDEIFLIGGLGVGATHFELLDTVTVLNTKTQIWKERPRLPFPTFAPAAGAIQNELFVFGGMFKTGKFDYRYVNHIYKLPLNEDHWDHSGRHLYEAKGFSQVVPLGKNQLGILGGHSYESGDDKPVNTFEVFKASAGKG